MAQLTKVLNDILAHSIQARRRHVCLVGKVVVPMTPRMRLVCDDLHLTSLQEVYEAHCVRQKLDPDQPLLLCRETLDKHKLQAEVDRSVQAQQNLQNPQQPKNVQQQQQNAQQQARQKLSSQKLALYNEICQQVPADLLARHVNTSLRGDAEALWGFKRKLAMQLAALSLLCHAFGISERQPHRFILCEKTARLVASDLRPGYTSHGQLEATEEVPFRLTRNITTLLSPLLVDGVFASSMAATALALSNKQHMLKPYLVLLLRDDLQSWHAAKAPPRPDIEQRQHERQLQDRVNKNASRALERIEKAAPRLTSSTRHEQRVDYVVHRLIEAAAQPERLCLMSPIWMPWL